MSRPSIAAISSAESSKSNMLMFSAILVQDQQVDLIDAELAGALLETSRRLVVSVVADPDLGLTRTRG